MKMNVPPRDIEQLSAYLDRQLTERDRVRLEKRLRSSPELVSALEDLRRTRALLRSLPPIKAPRSFKLSPQMVAPLRPPQPERRPLFPVFQYASAFATLLLVMVLIGDFLGFRFGSGVPSTAAEPQPPVAMQSGPARSAESTLPVQGAAPMAAPAATTAPSESQVQALDAASTATAQTESAASGAALNPEPTVGALKAFSPQITGSTNTFSSTVPLAPTEPGGAVLGNGALPTVSALQAQSSRQEVPPVQPGLPPVRIAEIILALTAIGSALAAFLLRRSAAAS